MRERIRRDEKKEDKKETIKRERERKDKAYPTHKV